MVYLSTFASSQSSGVLFIAPIYLLSPFYEKKTDTHF